jgi:hypothetical protein
MVFLLLAGSTRLFEELDGGGWKKFRLKKSFFACNKFSPPSVWKVKRFSAAFSQLLKQKGWFL